MNHILDHCKLLVFSPDVRKQYLLDIRKQGRLVAGGFSNYIPEEIMAAAGFHPIRIIGAYKTAPSGGRPLFNPVCTFVQDTYRAACAGEFAEMEVVVFPNSCDSLKVLRDLWNFEIKTPPAYALLHPVHNDRDSILYFADQLRLFAAELSRLSGIVVSQASLEKNIESYNHTRRLLRQLYGLRQTGRCSLKGSQAVVLMTAGLILDRDVYNTMLQQVIEFSSHNPSGGKNQKKIMIIGPLLDHVPLLEKIEQCGASLMDEDVTNGARYCDRDVQIRGDLYESIAERYLLAAPSPTMNDTTPSCPGAFADKIRSLNPDGVIFINQKFCEPHVHNYLAKIDVLRQMRISTLMLEIDHGRVDVNERDTLRIESFIEMAANN